ncbi:MAG: hypothetical protein J7K84_00235 [Deltaproteobacteria bacterium]|nr:hypothetical protein [Deltaproteobacteria bacterium]
MNNKEILMVKFYVVDGVSYPAAETAVGHFGGHGYESMRVCREAGITNAKYKGSMSLKQFNAFMISSGFSNEGGESNTFETAPLDYYLKNHGFGVVADKTELFMAEQYLVHGTPYVRSEEIAKLYGKKGFEAMYAVCKLGGFYGAKNKCSMSLSQFQEREKKLNLLKVVNK